MSYRKVQECIADLHAYANAKTRPVEFDLGSAIFNLSQAIESDFDAVHREVRDLKDALVILAGSVLNIEHKLR